MNTLTGIKLSKCFRFNIIYIIRNQSLYLLKKSGKKTLIIEPNTILKQVHKNKAVKTEKTIVQSIIVLPSSYEPSKRKYRAKLKTTAANNAA